MLTMNGAITQAQLELALDLQKQLRQRTINKDEALTQLSRSTTRSPSLNTLATNFAAIQTDDNIASIFQTPLDQSQSQSPVPRNIDLGELLLISGLITESEADTAFDISVKTNKNVEDVLVASGLCSSTLIDIALELQKHVNSGDVSPAAAAESLTFIDDHR
jgi:hypothetical protein